MTMVQYGGEAVKTVPLSISQNLFCLILASGELFWGVLIKLLPTRLFAGWISLDEAPS